jgi:biopolymer transport protein ExbB
MTCALCVIIFSVERILTLRAAEGKGSIADFIKRVQSNLIGNNVAAAIAECDKQKGSVANVVRSGLMKYQEMASNTELEKDQKIAAIQQEVEEATALEMPMLERNMPVLSTIASVGTLIALLGTVLGMIRAFSAMANSGAPDAVALSTGISEALINTALGIGTSAVAIIMYNYFTSKIDGMSYRIDEASFSMGQTFATHNK